MSQPSVPTVKPKSSNQKPNSLRLDQKTLDALLDKLDADDTARNSRSPGRHFTRWAFRHVQIPLTIHHPGGSVAHVVVASRNLSITGLSALHSSYVHTGSACEVELPRPYSGGVRLSGTIVRCRQVAGVVHEVGIEFSRQVSVREFVRPDVLCEFFSLEKVTANDLEGSILHIETSPVDQQLVKHFLSETRLRVRSATTMDEAFAIAREGVDVILTDTRMEGGDASALITKLRENTIPSPVIVTSNDSSSTTRAQLRQACPDGYLAKPLSQDRVLRALAELLLLENAARKSEAKPGQANTDSLSAVVEVFIAELQKNAQALQACVRTNDVATCSRICREIRGTAPSLGFTLLSQIAERTEKAISSVVSVAEAARSVQELINACARATR